MTTPSSADSGSDPSSRTGLFGRGWLHPTILGAAILGVAAGYGQFGITTVLGDVAEAFGRAGESGTADGQVGLQATTLGFGLAIIRLAAIGSMPASSLADRYGRRRLLLTLAAVGLGLTVLAAGSTGFWMFVAIVAAGRPLLSGTNTIASVIAAEETTSSDRSKAIALIAAAYALGAGIVSIVHGVLGEAAGFRGVLAISGVFLVLLPVVSRYIEETPLFTAHHATEPRRLGSIDRDLWPRLGLLAGLTMAVALVTGPAFTFLFVYGENVLGASPGFMALVVLGAGPVGLLGLLAGRWGADNLGRRVTSGIAIVFVAVGATVTYGGTTTGLALGYLLAIVAAGAYGPPHAALAAEIFPTEERATAGGWIGAAGVIGSVAGLAAFGALSDALGDFSRAGLVLFLPTIPLALLYRFLPETRGRELDEVPAGPGMDVAM